MIRQTSLMAYNDLRDNPILLGERQFKVYTVFKNLSKATNEEVQGLLNWPINCITGRTRELVKAGLLEEKGKKVNKRGRLVIVWGVLS